MARHLKDENSSSFSDDSKYLLNWPREREVGFGNSNIDFWLFQTLDEYVSDVATQPSILTDHKVIRLPLHLVSLALTKLNQLETIY